MKLTEKRDTFTPAALSALADGNLANFHAAMTPGGIEAQERRGQMEQARKQTLPLDLGQRYGGSLQEARKPWEALGFKFGNSTDSIFVEATFPAGWQKRPTDHSMWSEIVDDKGRKRGMIFYKAAFYDRSAHARLERRFGVSQTYGGQGATTEDVFVTDACGKIERRVDGLEKPDWQNRDKSRIADDKINAARAELLAWLKENYPEFHSPTAYWDDAP